MVRFSFSIVFSIYFCLFYYTSPFYKVLAFFYVVAMFSIATTIAFMVLFFVYFYQLLFCVKNMFRRMLQETYELEDLWYYDPCTSDKGHWSNNNILSFNTDGVCVIGNDSNVSFLDITYPQNYSIECTLTEPNGQNDWTGALRCGNLGLVGERNKRHYQIMSPYSYSSETGKFAVNDAIKIIVENGTAKLYYNGVEKKSTSATSDKFELLGSPSNNYYMRIKDIKIKAL